LLVAVVATSLMGCAASTSQLPSVQVPIASASVIAGKWAGTVRRDPSTDDDWVDLTIKDDGTYEVKSFRQIGALLGTGHLTISGGKMTSETERARATYTLYEGDGKRALNVDGVLKNGVTFSGWLTPGK
jgi:hypothetical protein